MGFKIALSFEDGVTKFIDVTSGETVAEAAYRQKINIPIDCRDGACGTCKSVCEAGEFDPGSYIDDAMTEEELKKGFCLTCQMRPKSDCVVKIKATSIVCKSGVSTFDSELESIEKISPSIFSVQLRLKNPELANFLPGQYANLHVPGTTNTRSYSFSSAPRSEKVTFLIKNVSGGVMSTYLEKRAKMGDPVSLTGPMGTFYIRDFNRPLLLLAGGTGIAPFLSILQQLKDKHFTQPVHLVYGARTTEDLISINYLEAMTRSIHRFSFTTTVSSPESIHPRKGYVTDHVQDDKLCDGNADTYLCGPPKMVEAVQTFFSNRRIKPRHIHFEKFAPTG